MRFTKWMVLGLLFVATSAVAGPKVPKNLRDQVPQEVRSATEAMEVEIEELATQIEAATIEAEREDGALKTLKFKVKAAKAAIDAADARKKAAKKSKDKQAVSAAKDEVAVAEEDKALAEDRLSTQKERVDLLFAEVALLEAKSELLDSDIQFRWADSLVDDNPDLDINRFEIAKTKAEIDVLKAEEDKALAEAKYAAHGGLEVDAQSGDAPVTGGGDEE